MSVSVTLTAGWKFYLEEWVIPEKCDLMRIRAVGKASIAFFGPSKMISAITRQDLVRWRDSFFERGKATGTARKHLSLYFAMCRFNAKHDRIKSFPIIGLPPSGAPVAEAFTPAEIVRLFAAEMEYRYRIFFTIDFETGARSTAIQQVTVGRCDFKRRVLDFRLPNVNHKKKRRGEVAMSHVLFDALWEAATRYGPPWGEDLIVPPGTKILRRMKPYVRGQLRPFVSTYDGCCEILESVGLKRRWVARHIGRKSWVTNAAHAGATSVQISAVVFDSIKTIEENYLFPKADQQHGLMNRSSFVPSLVPLPVNP